jgi:hypothetical protein
MDAAAERDVASRIRTCRIECIGIFELFRVAVRCAVEHHEGGSGGNIDAANGCGDT